VGAAQGHGQHQPSRRRGLRYGVQSPLDVTVLRSGIPDTLPGRSLNLCEGGIAAILAGELLPGETVGIEIKLPLAAGDPLRARGRVRHCDKLRSGMEFVGLSVEQQAAIRDWAAEAKAQPEQETRAVAIENAGGSNVGGSGGAPQPARRRNRVWILFLLAALLLLAGLWWRWRRGWTDLESNLPNTAETVQSPRPEVQVPAAVMEKLVIHRVDPEYPPAGRPARLQGVIALELIVGRDGSVLNVKALNGPDILAKAAVEALRWWRFEPYVVEGKPVIVETTVAVEFKP